MSAREFTITKLERDAAGVWRARVTGADGITVNVDRRYGCWQAEVRAAPRSRKMVRREVRREVAVALKARVRPIEKAERKAKDEAAQAAREAVGGMTRRARILADRPYRKREDREAAQIECPECQAPAEHHCVTRWGNPRPPHPVRRRARAAKRWPAVSDEGVSPKPRAEGVST